MRYLLLAVLLLVTVVVVNANDWLDELTAILQEYETATSELKADYQKLTQGLQASEEALIDSKARMNALESSFTAYKKETDETIRKLRIGFFALGGMSIVLLILVVIT